MAARLDLGPRRAVSLPDEGLLWHRHGHLHCVLHRQRLRADGAACANFGPAVAHRTAAQHGDSRAVNSRLPASCLDCPSNCSKVLRCDVSGLKAPRPILVPPALLQVLLYFLFIVSVLGLFGVLTAPDIIREASDFVTRLKSDNVWVVVLEKMRHGLG